MVSIAIGRTCSPPIFPIFPQDISLKFLGPFPPELLSDVANADNQTIEDLNAPRYSPNSSLPPVGSGAIFPSSISPTIILFPSNTATSANHTDSLPTCLSPLIHISISNVVHSL